MVVHQDPQSYWAFNTELSSQDSLISKCRKNMYSFGNESIADMNIKYSLDTKMYLSIISFIFEYLSKEDFNRIIKVL